MAHTNTILGYRGRHHWIQSRLGKPSECSNCNVNYSNNRRLQWANISGKYKKEISDWKRLCVRCHKAFDGHAGLLFKEYCTRGHKLTLDRLYFQRRTNSIVCKDCTKENTRASRLRKASK